MEKSEDAQYTRLTADLIMVTQGFCQYGEVNGLLSPDGLQFMLGRRKELAKQLSEAGKTQRQIAQLLGVSAATINSDLSERSEPEQERSEPEQEHEQEPEEAPISEIAQDEEEIEGEPEPSEDVDDDESGDDAQTVWRRGLMYRADDAMNGASFEDWSHFKVDKQLLQAVKKAAIAWNQLAAYMEQLYDKGA